jgi:hypothetical protein
LRAKRPPRDGRAWDPHLGLDVRLAQMPERMNIADPAPPPTGRRPTIRQPISRYGERALDNAVDRTVHAPQGQQRDTLNREVT